MRAPFTETVPGVWPRPRSSHTYPVTRESGLLEFAILVKSCSGPQTGLGGALQGCGDNLPCPVSSHPQSWQTQRGPCISICTQKDPEVKPSANHTCHPKRFSIFHSHTKRNQWLLDPWPGTAEDPGPWLAGFCV